MGVTNGEGAAAAAPSSTKASGLDLVGLTKVFPGGTVAVEDVDLHIDHGEYVVLLGPSGCGKTTTLRMIGGHEFPSEGDIVLDGQSLVGLAPHKRPTTTVFQHFALFPHRSVLENAAYGLEVQGVPRAEREARAAEALELTGLAGWEKSWPDELSGGMQQRVGLARALATDADLLLMDESFSALDPLIRRDMQDQLLQLQKTLKKTIVFITHDLNEAMRLGDRIAVMRDGRIVQIGSAEDILVRPADDYVASFTKDVDRSRVLTASAVMDTDVTGATADCGCADDCETATPDTPFTELCAMSARSGHPVAVLDAKHRLVGVVAQERLIGFLGDAESAQEAAHA